MKPMMEQHFSILRRHMVEVIEIQTERLSDELDKSALDERVLEVMGLPCMGGWMSSGNYAI